MMWQSKVCVRCFFIGSHQHHIYILLNSSLSAILYCLLELQRREVKVFFAPNWFVLSRSKKWLHVPKGKLYVTTKNNTKFIINSYDWILTIKHRVITVTWITLIGYGNDSHGREISLPSRTTLTRLKVGRAHNWLRLGTEKMQEYFCEICFFPVPFIRSYVQRVSWKNEPRSFYQ